MKKHTLYLMAALVCVGLCHITGTAQKRSYQGFSITTGPGKELHDCSQVKITVHDGEVGRSELTRTIPQNPNSPLKIQAPVNGGVYVQGWDRSEYSVKACLGAVGDSAADAKAILDQLSLSVRDGQLTVTGPNRQQWVGYLLLQAPNGATLDLSATNGPIRLNSITASVEARTTNGPISFSDVAGQVKAHALNGPINVSGNKGSFQLEAQNGPIDVDLEGGVWESGELEARTQNGPLSLSVPEGYQSSVRVEASRHSPVECRAVQCKQAVRSWDKPNIIEFGDSNPVIRMSTVNGPVTIVSAKDKDR